MFKFDNVSGISQTKESKWKRNKWIGRNNKKISLKETKKRQKVHKEGRKPDPSLLQVRLGANFMKDLVVGVRHRLFFHAPLPRLSGAPANPPAIIEHVFKHFRRLSTHKISRVF